MTKTYAMHKLLEHGDLTLSEAKSITGWPGRSTGYILAHLVHKGLAICKYHQQARQHRYSLKTGATT